jgi:hypothetical protein
MVVSRHTYKVDKKWLWQQHSLHSMGNICIPLPYTGALLISSATASSSTCSDSGEARLFVRCCCSPL